MKIYSIINKPQGIGYEELDYEAIYNSGYTAGYDSGYTAGQEMCEEIVVPGRLNFYLANSYDTVLNIDYSGSWTIEPTSAVTVSQSAGTGSAQVTVTYAATTRPCTGFPTYFGTLYVDDEYGRSKEVELVYVTCQGGARYIESITITSISGAKDAPATPIIWNTGEAPITLNWPSTGGSFTYNVKMHGPAPADWWDEQNHGNGNRSGLTMNVEGWTSEDEISQGARRYDISYWLDCCHVQDYRTQTFVEGYVDEAQAVATGLTWQAYDGCSGWLSSPFFSVENGQTIQTRVVPSPANAVTNLVFTSSNTAITIDSNGNITRNGGSRFEEYEVTVTDTLSNISITGSVFCDSVPYIFTLEPNDCPCNGVEYHNDCSCVPASGGTYHNLLLFSAPYWAGLSEVQLVNKPEWVSLSPSAWTLCNNPDGRLTFTIAPATTETLEGYRGGWVEFVGNDVSGLTGSFYIRQETPTPPAA